jgi:hypothetical protein
LRWILQTRKCSKRCNSSERPRLKRSPKSNRKRFPNVVSKCKIPLGLKHLPALLKLSHHRTISQTWDLGPLRSVIIIHPVAFKSQPSLLLVETGWKIVQALHRPKRHQERVCS